MGYRNRNRSKVFKIFAVFVLIIGFTINFNSYFYGNLLNQRDYPNYTIHDYDIPKLSSNHDLVWQKTWGYGTREWTPSITLDNESNVILVGNLDWFDDIFIAKYTPFGQQLWNKTWDKNSHDEPLDVALDNDNNIYVAGRTGTYGASNKVMLLIKFNSTGDELWHREWSGSNDIGARGIALDSDENVYVTGRPDSGDIFIRKYMPNGDLNWSRTWGGPGGGYEVWYGVYGMEIDNEDNIYITGRSDTIGAGGQDMIFLNYNTTGDLQWARSWGYSGDERGYDIVKDSENQLYVSSFSSTTNELMLIKYDASGNQIWNKTLGYFDIESGFKMDIDNDDIIYCIGTRQSNNDDISGLVLNKSGNILDEIIWSSVDMDRGYDIVLNENKEIYITGFTTNIGAGQEDIILLKYCTYTQIVFENSNEYLNPTSIYDDDTTLTINCSVINNESVIEWVYLCEDSTGTFVNQSMMSTINGGWTYTLNISKLTAGDTLTFSFYAKEAPNIIIQNNNNGNNFSLTIKTNPHFWILSPFVVDDNGGGDYNWIEAVNEDWCRGTGTWIDPYIIENVTIDGSIRIKDSNAFFIIKNCTAQIILDYANNGQLINNTANNFGSDNGITLYYSRNNTVTGNTASNNRRGIRLDNSNDNKILRNRIQNNWIGVNIGDYCYNNEIIENAAYYNDYGIHCILSDNNNITRNTAYMNNVNGIHIENCDNVIIKGNNVSNNLGTGIRLYSNSEDNLIYKNFLISNNIQAQDDGINNDWDNNSLGNYWSDYGGVDANDDGYGDTPYSIGGSAGSQDNYPIWDDGETIFPNISIISPTNYSVYGIESPSFQVSIVEPNLDSSWYSLNDMYYEFFTGENGTISQALWDLFPDGDVKITFWANNTDGLTDWDYRIVQKNSNMPYVNIISPASNQLFGENSPTFEVEIFDTNLDTMWYTIDGGVTNITFSTNGTINQNNWTSHIDGPVTIIFYANDTFGLLNSAQVIINKDTTNPLIDIISPFPNQLFGSTSPDFIVEISRVNLDTMWYTIDGGLNNITFISNGTINQASWNLMSTGTITIKFYANNTLGKITFQEVIVRKDIESPIISILSPTMNEIFEIPPAYEMTITEVNLDKIWYTFDDGVNMVFITETIGVMDLTLWNQLPNGYVTIRFYANDTLGNISFDEVIVVKDTPTPSRQPGGIPGYNVIILLGMISLIATFMIKKNFNKVKERNI